jgi:acetylornithine/succinyldiaminopimelate/putrescine aminotransferase
MQNTRTLFLKHLAQTSPSPLMLDIARAEGIYLYDKNEKRYADLIAGISVSNIGHRHPKVLQRINDQLDKFMHVMVYGEYILDPQIELATRISSYLPKDMQSVYLVNSGAEAIEGAMKLSKRYTGRSEIISFYKAYHGSTQGALSMIGGEEFKTAFRPLLPSILQVHFNNVAELEKITEKTAAIFVEPIQGEAGVVPATKEFMSALRKKCDETGTLLVFDEVQTGFGRTGKMFSYESYGVSPDIIVMAKGMGGGLPIGAFASSEKIMSTLTHEPVLGHITTFGGNPVCAAASLGVLDVLESEDLISQVDKKSDIFSKGLKELKLIKEVRSAGLLIAAEFESEEINHKVIAECIKRGVITDWFLFNAKSLRIAPPLTITEAQCEECVGVISEAVRNIQ